MADKTRVCLKYKNMKKGRKTVKKCMMYSNAPTAVKAAKKSVGKKSVGKKSVVKKTLKKKGLKLKKSKKPVRKLGFFGF